MKKQMLQNALNNVDDFRNIHTVGQQTRNATTFEEYKALVHSAADEYDKMSRAMKHATRNAYSHDLDAYNPVDHLYNGYDLDNDKDMIYANAADTHEGVISSDCFHQMTLEGHKICSKLSVNFHDPQVLVYFDMDDSAFPSESKEHCGCWVRISENVGHFMTFKVLANDTLKVIHWSNIHSLHDPTAKNQHLY